MGLQIYTDNKKPQQLIRLFGENERQIFEYVEELKKYGYEIVDFPPLECFRRLYHVNVKATPPLASE